MAEPFDRAIHRHVVDAGRRTARVDRPAHHRERAGGAGVVVAVHDRGGGEDRHRRLADRHDMRAFADMLEEADDVIHIVVEVELALVQRHGLGIGPVGHEHAVVLQHALDRAAQQRGVMAAHGRNDQQSRRILGQVCAVELFQIAEGAIEHGRLQHRIGGAIDLHRLDVPARLAVSGGGMGEHFERAGRHWTDVQIAHRVDVIERVRWIVEHFHPDRGDGAGRIQPAALQFIGVIEQNISPAGPAHDAVSGPGKDGHPAVRLVIVQRTIAENVPSRVQQCGFSRRTDLTACAWQPRTRRKPKVAVGSRANARPRTHRASARCGPCEWCGRRGRVIPVTSRWRWSRCSSPPPPRWRSRRGSRWSSTAVLPKAPPPTTWRAGSAIC